MSRKEPIDPRKAGLPKKTTKDITQWDCYNLYPGIKWERKSTGEDNGTSRDLGECLHYDDSEIINQEDE